LIFLKIILSRSQAGLQAVGFAVWPADGDSVRLPVQKFTNKVIDKFGKTNYIWYA
jgi:hypothetical protein